MKTLPNLTLEILDKEFLSVGKRAETYLGWLMNPDVTRFLEVRKTVIDEESIRRFVAEHETSVGQYLYALVSDIFGFVGTLRIHSISDTPKRTAELGLMIGEVRAWGRGYGTSAIREACEVGQKRYGLVEMTAGCNPHNRASLTAFLRNNFIVEDFDGGDLLDLGRLPKVIRMRKDL
jgi:RimJ/RimL family protein N-acetyltransferase